MICVLLWHVLLEFCCRVNGLVLCFFGCLTLGCFLYGLKYVGVLVSGGYGLNVLGFEC